MGAASPVAFLMVLLTFEYNTGHYKKKPAVIILQIRYFNPWLSTFCKRCLLTRLEITVLFISTDS